MSRRAVLGASLLVPAAGLVSPLLRPVPAAAAARLRIRPRDTWGAGLPSLRELDVESPRDVRFLLVHHTATSNDYRPDDVVGLLRGFYRFHTGPERQWPDIAYNFLIDRYGGVWEGRTGSLRRPVAASASGGSQGFAQLACFIGDHEATLPTVAARASMLRLLAELADRYGIDTRPGATAAFVSRGSSRWPTGTEVTTTTIAGHRDMSVTPCPGNRLYTDLRDSFAADVTALRGGSSNPSGFRSPPRDADREREAGPAGGNVPPAQPQGSSTPSVERTPASTASEERAAAGGIDVSPLDNPWIAAGAAGVIGAMAAAPALRTRLRSGRDARG